MKVTVDFRKNIKTSGVIEYYNHNFFVILTDVVETDSASQYT